uniref:N-acetylglucosaminyl-phosphatidylinositol de-N-acetylase-like isoform X2 n=1 Tax=Rhizophora mucronata TaxID=61149 RepID=A0A2P2LF06_RHIMU
MNGEFCIRKPARLPLLKQKSREIPSEQPPAQTKIWQPIGNLNYLLTLICLRGKWLDLGVSFCRKESCKCDL